MDNERLQRAMQLAALATERDHEGDYAAALNYYLASIESWNVICKYETDAARRKKLFAKMEVYVSRAELLKQVVSNTVPYATPTTPPLSTAAVSASVTANGTRSTNSDSSRLQQAPTTPPLPPTVPTKPTTKPVVTPSRPAAVERRQPFNQDASHGRNGNSSHLHPPDDDRARLKAQILAIAQIDTPSVTWDDVIGLERAKEALQEATVLPTRFPELFRGNVQPWRGILLYGPPGTGKTHLARACASACRGACFMAVSSADLLSKWQGESEKLIRSLFDVARENAPSVVFVDEVDSLCGTRNDRENESSRRVKTEFLVQMDGLRSGSGDGSTERSVLVLGATNAPWDLDPAIRRRFERRIYVPLPDGPARAALLRLLLPDGLLSSEEIDALSYATEGYSAADISIAVRDARLEPVRRCRNATYFRAIPATSKYEPCSPTTPGAERRSLFTLASDELQPPALTARDILRAVQQTKRSVLPADLERYISWTNSFGIDGS